MIELRRVSWKNFLSYGDYVSTIELDSLGQVSIIGEIEGEISKSNGAGKSTIANVIQWGLFGRTMHSASPGNNVINYHTKKDCWVKLEFKNGDQVIRTRSLSGHNELLYIKDGHETKLTGDTASTDRNMQEQLNKLFQLDYELFIYGVFFNQYGKSWAEQTESARRKILERLLRVDRYSYYAKVAKSRVDAVDNNGTVIKNSISGLENNIVDLRDALQRENSSSDSFEQNKANTVRSYLDQIKDYKTQHDTIPNVTVEQIKDKIELVEAIKVTLQKNESLLSAKNTERSRERGACENVVNQVRDWEKKKGTICFNCKQVVAAGHVDGNVEGLKQSLLAGKKKLETLDIEIQELNKQIASNRESIENNRPEYTIDQIREFARRKASIIDNVRRLVDKVKLLRQSENPHRAKCAEIEQKIVKAEERLASLKQDSERQQLLYRHLMYIYKTYNDKNKLKSLIYKEFVPAFNNRLKKYLEVLKMDLTITLNDNLSMNPSAWGYEYMSGGERKRIDVAFMFALYDMHEYLHGRQCNVLILDEVDGKLDDEGIESFIYIIKNEIAPRVESVLVISHRPEMHSVFEREITVKRVDRFSLLETY